MDAVTLMLPLLAVLGLLNSGIKRPETHIKDFIVALLVVIVMSFIVGALMGVETPTLEISTLIVDGIIAYIVGLVVGYARESIRV